MKTLICQHPDKIEYIERTMPELEAGEALLKIKTVGICGTDIHAFAGRQPFFSYPRVLGHEICGVVEAVGSACSRVKKGLRYARKVKPTVANAFRCTASTRMAVLASTSLFAKITWSNCRPV